MDIHLPEAVAGALEQLNGAGFEAYAVGGCVRDSLLFLKPCDWDIATDAKPGEIKLCFSNRRVLETGLKHGTLTVMFDKMPVEITTYRIDGLYSDHRRPDSVNFTNNLKDDLSRRDFTINALAYHPQKGLIDYFNGQEDIKAKRIVCVGDAEKRFSEDALRILRAVRFRSALGFLIDEDSAAAMRKLACLLNKISPERIASELNKALPGEFISEALLNHAEIFTAIIPELAPMHGFNQRTRYHHLDVWRHTVAAVETSAPDVDLRLTMLFHDIAKPQTFTVDDKGEGHFYNHANIGAEISDRILERLRYDNATRNRVVYLIKHHCDMLTPEPKLLKRALNRMGTETFLRLIEVKRADCRARAEKYRAQGEKQLDEIQRQLDLIINENQAFSLRDLAVNGDDLISAGFSQGKAIGEMLQRLLRFVIDEELANEREALLSKASSLQNEP